MASYLASLYSYSDLCTSKWKRKHRSLRLSVFMEIGWGVCEKTDAEVDQPILALDHLLHCFQGFQNNQDSFDSETVLCFWINSEWRFRKISWKEPTKFPDGRGRWNFDSAARRTSGFNGFVKKRSKIGVTRYHTTPISISTTSQEAPGSVLQNKCCRRSIKWGKKVILHVNAASAHYWITTAQLLKDSNNTLNMKWDLTLHSPRIMLHWTRTWTEYSGGSALESRKLRESTGQLPKFGRQLRLRIFHQPLNRFSRKLAIVGADVSSFFWV